MAGMNFLTSVGTTTRTYLIQSQYANYRSTLEGASTAGGGNLNFSGGFNHFYVKKGNFDNRIVINNQIGLRVDDMGHSPTGFNAGVFIENQSGASANYSIVLDGTDSGSDIVFGATQDAGIYYTTGDDLIIDLEGSLYATASTLRIGAPTTNYTEVSATGDVTFVGTAGIPYGEISVNDNAGVTTITNTEEWYRITVFDTNGLSNNVTTDHTNDHLIVTSAGHYKVNSAIVTQSTGAAKTLHLGVFTNTKAGGVADSVDAGTDVITDASHVFNDGDLVAIAGTECGITTDVMYTVCADNGSNTYQLDETLLCGGDCSTCDSALNITACTPAQAIEVRQEDTNVHAHRRLSGGSTDQGSITVSGMLDVAVNEELEMWLHNETNTVDILVEDATFTIFQLGGT